MPNPRLASRYAKAILDLSLEQHQADVVLKDMQQIVKAATDSREFASFLQSPIIKGDKKQAAFDAIFKEQFNPLTMQFVHLLINKNREANLEEIAVAFEQQYNEHNSIQDVTIITAAPMNETVRNEVLAKAALLTPGMTVAAHEVIDPSIIGGFIIEIGDSLYDASVKKELNDIKKSFASSIIVPTI